MHIEEFIARAEEKAGSLYRWGAFGPSRFDCSGFIGWLLSSFGHIFAWRWVAADFWNQAPHADAPDRGRLAFWRNRAGKVFHIALVTRFDDTHVWCLGAHGGGPSTTSDEVAQAQKAYVHEKRFTRAGIAGYRLLPGTEPSAIQTHPHLQEPPPHEDHGEPPEDWV